MSAPVIAVENLSKRFRIYDQPVDRLKEWLTPRGMSFHWAFWALRDITLTVPRGSALGIVGANGAGKSTLLKILCGTLSPTAGAVSINGRVTGLLELGSGFHPEFTGRQNVFLNARMLGLSEAEIEERLPRIIAFAELGEFINHPLRIYSTGMALRLGFAVAASIDPDVLIVDEALAVGDAYFQQKCVRHIRRFQEEGGTLLFVSHDPGAVKLLCNEAVLLHEGRILHEGRPDDVLNYYNALIARHVSDQATFRIERQRADEKQPASQRSGTFDAILGAVQICVDGQPTRTIVSGATAAITVEAVALSDIAAPTIGIAIRDRLGYEVFGTNTFRLRKNLPALRAGDRAAATFTLPLSIGPGDYTVTAAIHSGADHLERCYDWADKFVSFKVLPESDACSEGVARLPVEVAVSAMPGRKGDAADLLNTLFGDAPSRIALDDETETWMFAGWHPVEKIESAQARWAEQTATFVVRVGQAGRVCIEAATDPSLCGAEPLGVSLYANGEHAGTQEMRDASWQSLVFTMPYACAGRVVRFTLQCARAFVPATQYGTTDQRSLALLVRRIWSE
ncbi:ABC transporter ATP-binding protein [bacterium]|nr:ABC transporter ATP-binding protein [bacterium]